jgi:hypothetical protein
MQFIVINNDLMNNFYHTEQTTSDDLGVARIEFWHLGVEQIVDEAMHLTISLISGENRKFLFYFLMYLRKCLACQFLTKKGIVISFWVDHLPYQHTFFLTRKSHLAILAFVIRE